MAGWLTEILPFAQVAAIWCRWVVVESSIKKAFMRTLATGAFLMAVVPTSAVVLTRPHPPKAIVLEMTLEPTGPPSDNPMMHSLASR